MLAERIGKNLKHLRKKNNLTQEEVSLLLQISRQGYAHFENCRRLPDLELIILIADLYRIPTDLLLCHDLTQIYRSTPSLRQHLKEKAKALMQQGIDKEPYPDYDMHPYASPKYASQVAESKAVYGNSKKRTGH